MQISLFIGQALRESLNVVLLYICSMQNVYDQGRDGEGKW